MVDDDLELNDSPDEWQELADNCSAILAKNNFPHRVLEEGILDTIELAEWELFREYVQFIPVYSFSFDGKPEREISICVAKLGDIRSRLQ
ncbi:MAG TPA: hypothetical protein VFO76_09330, partial [Candidatus Kapabacteria bacterium]|nr:hypothetical protein [Candidatus Kapabacteria bacterium]